ncbi:sigma-70 family RNA polymerase sigma factor [Luteolibacter flavescens]|uniref:Sigma-70 family RNA polymerase sigma factor n=1 Tax=Luteolibacter flavescens TaxID=1859460 RepID=A0ABT3FRQ3_9BACT|nr:sigma-70 family RNA polymerase sigma factor [Luteolibacter flavescens]MCW1886271.1 sigma-70 family RNA polymerase sigma factor [Luteolibacter flavescens]
MRESSDAELLSDWLKRQRETAFHALVARYAGLVHMAALRTCEDEALAAEASQLTFITLARKARSLASRGSVAGWLHITAVMHAKNLLRQHRRESRKRQLLRTHMETSPPDHAAEAWKNMQPVLDEALAALSTSDRETLLLRFYRSLSVKEIAAALGIATDAAQKRLDRATERLRQQLARRGCQVGGSLGAAMVAGLGADAQAAIPGVATLATKALAATAAGGATTLTTITLIAMTKKTAITAGAALLLVGAGAVAFINRDTGAPAGNAPEVATTGKQGTGTTGGLAPTEESTRAPKAKPRETTQNSDLIAQYGESRTNLSKHVANNVIGLFEDGVAMGEMATTGEFAGAFGGPRAHLGRSLGGLHGRLNLTDEQQDKAAAALAEYQKREIARSKENIENLKKDPTALMKLMLASDSYSRGDITEEEWKAAQLASGDELKGVMNPLDRNNLRGQPLKDDQFVSDLSAVLDPAQTETLQREMTEQQAREASGNGGGITNMPSMNLEELDSTITSAKKVTAGMKGMMEGMGGLQGLGPMMEQQRRAREAAPAEEAPESTEQ